MKNYHLMCYDFNLKISYNKNHIFFYLDVNMHSLKFINHCFDSNNVYLEFLVLSYNLCSIPFKAVNSFIAVIKTVVEKDCLPLLYDKYFNVSKIIKSHFFILFLIFLGD